MKKRIKIIVILSCVFVLSLAAFVLSSCTLKKLTKDDLIEMGYDHIVTFDFNGGKMGELTTLEVGVEENYACPEPGSDSVSDIRYDKPARSGYIFDGYYLGEKDEDGNLTLTEKWDFKTKITEDVTLYVKWRKAYTLVINYVDEEATEEKDRNKTYSVTVNQDSDGIPQEVKIAPDISGFTVISFYRDAAHTESKEITFPLKPNSDELNAEKTEMVIYAKVLKGKWKVIKNLEEFKDYSIGEGSNVYLLCDIDMNDIYNKDGKEVDWNNPEEAQEALARFKLPPAFNGKFEGNNHKISNFRLRQEQKDKNDKEFGIFKTLGESAYINNITFENVNFYAKITNPLTKDCYVGLLAGRAAEGAKIENVTVSGTIECDITIDAVAEKTEVYPLLGDDNQYCTPVNCDYQGVTVIKNGEEVDWTEHSTTEPDTAE